MKEQKSAVFKKGLSGLLDLRRRKQQEGRGNYLVIIPQVVLLQARLGKWIRSAGYIVRIAEFRSSCRSFIGKTCSQNASWCVCVRARVDARIIYE